MQHSFPVVHVRSPPSASKPQKIDPAAAVWIEGSDWQVLPASLPPLPELELELELELEPPVPLELLDEPVELELDDDDDALLPVPPLELQAPRPAPIVHARPTAAISQTFFMKSS